jgi:hypothetical protein
MDNPFDYTHNLITYCNSEHQYYKDWHEPQFADGYGQFGRYSLWNAGLNQSFKNQSPNRVAKRRAKKKLGNQSRKKNYGH